jgi:Peptide N-acetyl-beta-D-glucosaminyl asparaginase amidase A
MKIRLLAAFLVSTAAAAQPTPVTPLTIGSANTATADPTVPRPKTTPCRVRLFTDLKFADFSAKFFGYAPPAACPGPWEKVVLEADYSVEAGRQFDRTATLWIGGVNVYFGTTAEPSRTVARAWHVERDLTEYSDLLQAPAQGRAELGNLVNSTFTSSLFGTAQIAFYPRRGGPSRGVADLVLPLSAGATGGTVLLFNPADELSATFQLPRNVERAYLDVVLQHQGANDEFWYTCVPTNLAGELQSCVGTAFREGQLSIDGQPAGVVPIFPWIFTGGVDPFFWRPIPAPQALNFVPYRVDVTPFAGVLSDGQPHRFAIRVTNDSNFFSTTATLLVYLDHRSTQVTGAVTRNTIGTPSPTIDAALKTDPATGTISGTVTTTSSRQFVLAGWVKTSHGRVQTEIAQRIDFSNVQQFVSPQSLPETFVQDIRQSTAISSTTTVDGGRGSGESTVRMSWPLEMDLTVNIDASGNFVSQIGRVKQAYNRVDSTEDISSLVSNSGEWADTFPTQVGQSGAQRYFSSDSEGHCFSRSLTAAGGVLTSIVDGKGCEDD